MRIPILLAAVLLPPLAPVVAQETSRSPHGELAAPCAQCHAPDRWTPARVRGFDHGRTGFVLSGAHAQTGCRGCHATLDFKQTPSTCAACHTDVHRSELGADCAQCHTARSFLDRAAMTRAHQVTRFPLTGSHVAVDCEACHTPTAQGRLRFVNTSTQCIQCHGEAYRTSKEPDHVAGGFPTTCDQCHSTATWPGARFNHAVTRFPLTGAHRAVRCEQCHAGGAFRGTSSTCVACHRSDYDGTTQPGHRAAGLPTGCTACHTTTAWAPAPFDHSGTDFPLTGAHRSVSCEQCHGDGVYAGKSTACVSCHQADYDRTSDPGHRSAGFPTTCTDCHTTSTWTGATFDHDASFFPIYSGRHQGEWASCSTCHTSPASFQAFTCLTCHQHSRAETDGHHGDVSGYRYDSQACYSCHPRGIAE
jgi:hypothetical protein